MRHVTVKDVAAAAGVSVSTVSKALNGRGKLRAETRARVLRAAEQLAFVPNALAQGLLAGRSFSVALITPEKFGRLCLEVMLGAQDVLGAERIPVLMGEFRGDPSRERRYMETFSARQVDGLIVASRRIESVQALRASPGIPAVYAMGRPVGAKASRYCRMSRVVPAWPPSTCSPIGCHRIAHVTGPECMPAARLRAMRRGPLGTRRLPGPSSARRRRVRAVERVVGAGSGRPAASRARRRNLLRQRPDRKGRRRRAPALGRRIPDDVALVGCAATGSRRPLARCRNLPASICASRRSAASPRVTCWQPCPGRLPRASTGWRLAWWSAGPAPLHRQRDRRP